MNKKLAINISMILVKSVLIIALIMPLLWADFYVAFGIFLIASCTSFCDLFMIKNYYNEIPVAITITTNFIDRLFYIIPLVFITIFKRLNVVILLIIIFFDLNIVFLNKVARPRLLKNIWFIIVFIIYNILFIATIFVSFFKSDCLMLFILILLVIGAVDIIMVCFYKNNVLNQTETEEITERLSQTQSDVEKLLLKEDEKDNSVDEL